MKILLTLLLLSSLGLKAQFITDYTYFYQKKTADSLAEKKQYKAAIQLYKQLQKSSYSNGYDHFYLAQFYFREHAYKKMYTSIKACIQSQSFHFADTSQFRHYPMLNDPNKWSKKARVLLEQDIRQQAQQISPPLYPHLVDTLKQRLVLDQAYRVQMHDHLTPSEKDSIGDLINYYDKNNQTWLKEQLAIYKTWLGFKEVGSEGEHTVWLIAQHADLDTAFQKTLLPFLLKALQEHNTSRSNVAYLVDRILVNQGQAQIFGTQFLYSIEDNEISLAPKPLQEPFLVNTLREYMLLPSLEDYLKSTKEHYTKRNKEHEKK